MKFQANEHNFGRRHKISRRNYLAIFVIFAIFTIMAAFGAQLSAGEGYVIDGTFTIELTPDENNLLPGSLVPSDLSFINQTSNPVAVMFNLELVNEDNENVAGFSLDSLVIAVGENKTLSYSLLLPENAEAGTYTARVRGYFEVNDMWYPLESSYKFDVLDRAAVIGQTIVIAVVLIAAVAAAIVIISKKKF